jgi:hypothetical protein
MLLIEVHRAGGEFRYVGACVAFRSVTDNRWSAVAVSVERARTNTGATNVNSSNYG